MTQARLLGLFAIVGCMHLPCAAQNEKASINSSIANDGTGSIIVEARGQLPEAALIFTATCDATVKVGKQHIDQEIRVSIKVIQGNARTISLGVNGTGRITAVEGDQIESWSVRQVATNRFLDLQLKENSKEVKPLVKLQSDTIDLPAAVTLTHLTPGDSIGFDSQIKIQYQSDIDGSVANIKGFAPISTSKGTSHFRTSTGGQIDLSLRHSGASPGPVELVDTKLSGNVHANGQSIQFQLLGTALVSEPNAEITVLTGKAAAINLPADAKYRLRLAMENKLPVHKLVFAEKGKFPLELNFIATLAESGDARSADFTV
ncbi:MAG: hypothetical protein WBD31_10095, partial [Rubripirellula sp.]